MREGLDVLHECREPVDATLKRTRGDDLRLGEMAGDTGDDRSLLARDIPVRPDLDVDEPIAVVTASPLADCGAQRRLDIAVGARRVDESPLRPHRLGRMLETVQD